MDLIFNEVSLNDKPQNKYNAKSVLELLAETCSCLKKLGFNKIRTVNNFWIQEYFENKDISAFLSEISRTKGSFLRSFIRPPYVANGNESVDDKFIENEYYLNESDYESISVTGLAYAYFFNTIAVSLFSNDIWNKSELSVLEKTHENEQEIAVKHASKSEHCEAHKDWVTSQLPVTLVKTKMYWKNKEVKLRDDHGKEVLLAFAKKIVKSEYVIKVVNSLPFNPQENNFTKKCYPNGQIELVLIETDRGLGLIIQTTGRNQSETEEIAKILEKEFK